MRITCKGWPWQRVHEHWATALDRTAGERWGWNPFRVKGMGRFGGGWAIIIGIEISQSGKDVILNCGIGSIRIRV